MYPGVLDGRQLCSQYAPRLVPTIGAQDVKFRFPTPQLMHAYGLAPLMSESWTVNDGEPSSCNTDPWT